MKNTQKEINSLISSILIYHNIKWDWELVEMFDAAIKKAF